MSEGLIGVLIGGAITFLSGFFIEHRKQKKDEIKFKREKLETLYFNYSRWETFIGTFYTMQVLVNEKKIDLETLNKNIKSDEMGNIYTKTTTILNLYFVNLKDKYNTMDIAKGELIECLTVKGLKLNNPELIQAYSSFKAASEELKKAMSDEVQKIEKSC
ncbi:hypothetical protein [Aliarcobacter cryaerophilus]|uniref:hypothetical protein n=1 Tax=Aliarcobacter cryaerophilus TaxID=28198 RepID=UPI003BAE8A6D